MSQHSPTFEEIRKWTRNGKERVRILIYATSVECRAIAKGKRAQIDFDLYSCNYDLQSTTQERLRQEYNEYCRRTNLRPKFHSHFSRTSIWFEVHRDDAETWFQRILNELRDVQNVTLCEAALEFGNYLTREADELLLGAIVEPVDKVKDGDVVRLLTSAWLELVRMMQSNPNILYTIDPRKLEELIAGAYDKSGFDRVVLTPRSGDLGRDVIAEKHGWGCVKIVEQVKAFKPGHLVTANDVRALGHILAADQSTSKGIITTTSDFAPRIKDDPLIAPFMPTRIELVNGKTLLDRLVRLLHGEKP